MRTTPTSSFDPPYLITSTSIISFGMIDTNARLLPSSLTTNVRVIKPNFVTTDSKPSVAIKTADKYMSTTTVVVIMDCEAEALM